MVEKGRECDAMAEDRGRISGLRGRVMDDMARRVGWPAHRRHIEVPAMRSDVRKGASMIVVMLVLINDAV